MAHTEKKCGYCAYLKKDLSNIKQGRFPCERDYEYHYADQEAPGRCFTEIFWRDIDKAQDAVRESRIYRGRGCFIATAIMEILGYGSDNLELRTLQEFRGGLIAENSEFRDRLMKYDIIAPVIASRLKTLPNAKDIAEDLYLVYIKGCVDCIMNGQNEMAIDLYSDLVTRLMDEFQVSYTVGDVAKQNYRANVGTEVSPFDGGKHSI